MNRRAFLTFTTAGAAGLAVTGSALLASGVNTIELTAATSFWNMMARNLNALQVELEPWGR